jgi:hypothetical protein
MHYVVYDYIGVAHILNVLYVTFQTYEPNVQVLWLALLLVLLDSESKPHTGYWISGDFFSALSSGRYLILDHGHFSGFFRTHYLASCRVTAYSVSC